MRRKSFLSNPTCIVPIAKPDKVHEAFVLPKDVFYARPHPGLLPQEKVNRSPSHFQFTVSGVRTTSIQMFKNRSQQCPLLGERKQVRASVKPIGAPVLRSSTAEGGQRRRYTTKNPVLAR
jgi:hypothetical protein